MPVRPVIGMITAPNPKLLHGRHLINTSYVRAVIAAGGTPLLIPSDGDDGLAAEYLPLLHGLLVPGGEDVTPALYGEDPLRQVTFMNEEKDRMELALIRGAVDRGMPVFGICRGIQLLNAALGGTLWQDLPTQCPSEVDHHQSGNYASPIHTVALQPGTPLAELLGPAPLPVNSLHHQAVRTLAPALAPMAVAPDGIVEAVYEPGRTFVWAVQWHPEFSWQTDANSRAIFRAFVDAC